MGINKVNVGKTILNSQSKSTNISKEQLQLLRKQGLSLKEIADSLHISTNTVTRYIKAYKIPLLKTDLNKIDKNLLAKINSLIEQGLSINKIAKQLKTSYGKVRVILEHFNLKTQQAHKYTKRKQQVSSINNTIDNNYLNFVNFTKLTNDPLMSNTHNTFLESITKNDLEELVNNGHSIDDIAYMFATSRPYIAKLFNKYGIKSHRL